LAGDWAFIGAHRILMAVRAGDTASVADEGHDIATVAMTSFGRSST
jgi:hypothetical protein